MSRRDWNSFHPSFRVQNYFSLLINCPALLNKVVLTNIQSHGLLMRISNSQKAKRAEDLHLQMEIYGENCNHFLVPFIYSLFSFSRQNMIYDSAQAQTLLDVIIARIGRIRSSIFYCLLSLLYWSHSTFYEVEISGSMHGC